MAKRFMSASERLVHELKLKINRYEFLNVFSKWEPNDFGKVDSIVKEQKEFELKNYGYCVNYADGCRRHSA